MRVLSRLVDRKKKRLIRNPFSLRSHPSEKTALSNIVAYVLLISITIALSVIVYGWLRFYVQPDDIEKCSDNVNIIIRSYQCFEPNATGQGGRLIVTLKNKGLFNVDGYELRVHYRKGADFGFYLFNDTGASIAPGEEITDTYLFNTTSFFDLNELTMGQDDPLKTVSLVEVQPFVVEDGEVRCRSLAFQEVKCQAP